MYYFENLYTPVRYSIPRENIKLLYIVSDEYGRCPSTKKSVAQYFDGCSGLLVQQFSTFG